MTLPQFYLKHLPHLHESGSEFIPKDDFMVCVCGRGIRMRGEVWGEGRGVVSPDHKKYYGEVRDYGVLMSKLRRTSKL